MDPLSSDRCPDDNDLTAMIQGHLPPEEVRRIEIHLDSCPDCMELVASLAEISAPPDATPAEPDKQRIGRYEIRGELGAGAQGLVYEGYDPVLQRVVAIKVVRPDRKRRGDEARLLREARLLATIAHPNVLPVYEVGELPSGSIFLATELLSGGTLRSLRGTGWQRIVSAALAAGSGLSAVHRAGLVHRDVKPDNFLLHRDGRAVLSDFGLASSDPHQESFVGTPLYLAPELVSGERASARSDQYAFCASLFELLNGAPPFRGKTLREIADACASGSVRCDPAVPERLNRAVLRGLSVDPSLRYRDMEELLSALQRASRPQRLPLVASIALASGGLLVIAALALLPQPQPSPPPAPAQEIPLPVSANPLVEMCEGIARDATPQLQPCDSAPCKSAQQSRLVQAASCYDLYGDCANYHLWYDHLARLQPDLPVESYRSASYRCPPASYEGRVLHLTRFGYSDIYRDTSAALRAGEAARALASDPRATSDQREALFRLEVGVVGALLNYHRAPKEARGEALAAEALWRQPIDLASLGG